MKDFQRKTLQVLLNKIDLLFKETKNERKKLHVIEWEGDDDLPSILGEAELFSDKIVGLSLSCVDENTKQISEVKKMLESNSLYQIDDLVKWIANDSHEFPVFTNYLFLVENLRVSSLHFIT